MVDKPAASERGRRLGWLGGGIGALCWLLPVAAVALMRGQMLAATLAVGGFVLGVVYLFVCAPWRFPHRPFALFYLGLVLIILLFAALLLWLLAETVPAGARLYSMLLPLLTLFIPLAIFGRRRWDELGPVLMRRDDGCGR